MENHVDDAFVQWHCEEVGGSRYEIMVSCSRL